MSGNLRFVLLAGAVALASAAQAQGLVEELPGGISKPADWHERTRDRRDRVPVDWHERTRDRMIVGPAQMPIVSQTIIPVPQPALQTYAPAGSSSQTIVIQGGGYRGSPPMGYPGYGPPLGGYWPAYRPHRGYGGVSHDRYGIPSYYSRGFGGGRGYRRW